MATYKRTTTKTGNNTKRTRTISSTGKTTQSFSSKPPGKNSTRRTVSFSNGKVRTTHSTKLGGGYTRVTSKTHTLSKTIKPKKTKSGSFSLFGGSKGRSRRKKEEEVEGGGEPLPWFWLIVFLPFTLPALLLGPGLTIALYGLLLIYLFG